MEKYMYSWIEDIIFRKREREREREEGKRAKERELVNVTFIESVGAKEDFQSCPHSPRPMIDITISNDSLTLNKRKERQDQLIYTYINI